MNKLVAILAIVGGMSLVSIADASARSRSVTVYGPRGVSTHSVSRSCAGGVCSRSSSTTGAYGRTASRQGTASCTGGVCTGSGVATGPHGGTVSYSGTAAR
jgi:hypothetical protein